mgnify:CR=1 FL=1
MSVDAAMTTETATKLPKAKPAKPVSYTHLTLPTNPYV